MRFSFVLVFVLFLLASPLAVSTRRSSIHITVDVDSDAPHQSSNDSKPLVGYSKSPVPVSPFSVDSVHGESGCPSSCSMPYTTPVSTSGWSVSQCTQKIADRAEAFAMSGSCGCCLAWVASFVEPVVGASGDCCCAKDYAPNLLSIGFKHLTSGDLQPGDVRIIQPGACTSPSINGHITMYTSKGWFSDFAQGSDWNPYYNCQDSQLVYSTYRFYGSSKCGGH